MVVDVKEDDNGELYIDLPPKLLEQLEWSPGDDIVWTVNDDGTLGLRKK